MTNIYDELAWRGLVYDTTEGAADLLAREKVSVYNGFDPTADSLHVGHLVPMVGLARLQRFGHHPIALAGGGTGMIGDPSGRSAERNLLSQDEIAHNVEKIKLQLASILDFEVKTNPAHIVNNAEWLSQLSLVEFLRDTGKHFTVNYMVSKDSVQSRLDREDGISYTEFSYMLLQSYDFLHLRRQYNCMMQTGGSDQWGNITAGIMLVRKVLGEAVHGLVYPLITRADGTKFGKTADGESVWLDPKRTSPYRFYQFFLNIEDAKVLDMLRYYTFLSEAEIAEYVESVAERPHQREAQRCLAQEVTRMVHGDGGVHKAEQAAAVLFGGEIAGLDAEEIQDIFTDVPSSQIAKAEFQNGGVGVIDLLASTGVAKSKGEARRLIANGGIYINNQRSTDADATISLEQSIEGKYLILRKGKKSYHLVQLQ